MILTDTRLIRTNLRVTSLEPDEKNNNHCTPYPTRLFTILSNPG